MAAKVAKIVFSQDYLSQTSGIASHGSPSTLFTPIASGLFRISFYLDCAGGGGQAQAQFFYTDDLGSAEKDYTAASGGNNEDCFVIRALEGDPISLAVTNGGDSFPSSYNLSVVLEEL